MKEKFNDEIVKKLFDDFTLLVISETHFLKRHKCPENFKLVGRSVPIGGRVGRGGVAVYVKRIEHRDKKSILICVRILSYFTLSTQT